MGHIKIIHLISQVLYYCFIHPLSIHLFTVTLASRVTLPVGISTQIFLQTSGIQINGMLDHQIKDVYFGTDDHNRPIVIKRMTDDSGTYYDPLHVVSSLTFHLEVKVSELVINKPGMVQGVIQQEQGRRFLVMKMYVTNICRYILLKSYIEETFILKQAQCIKVV